MPPRVKLEAKFDAMECAAIRRDAAAAEMFCTLTLSVDNLGDNMAIAKLKMLAIQREMLAAQRKMLAAIMFISDKRLHHAGVSSNDKSRHETAKVQS